MKPIEKILDIAFQKLSHGKRCHYCKGRATISHHIIRRSNKLYRWDKKNAQPVCWNCHTKIHNGSLREDKLYIEQDNIKDYRMRNCLTYDEFLKIKAKEYGIVVGKSNMQKMHIAKSYIGIPISKKKVNGNSRQPKSDCQKQQQEKANIFRRNKWKSNYQKKKQYSKRFK